jgi:hypothetical protein
MSLLLPFTLATLLTTDKLGYECVPEDHLEIAFSLGGKGMRVPQTCIVDPCAETFSELTLASYSGFRDDALYRDYRARMTDTCGTPTVWEDKGMTDQDLLWAVFDGGNAARIRPGKAPVVDAAPQSASATPRSNTVRPGRTPGGSIFGGSGFGGNGFGGGRGGGPGGGFSPGPAGPNPTDPDGPFGPKPPQKID